MASRDSFEAYACQRHSSCKAWSEPAKLRLSFGTLSAPAQGASPAKASGGRLPKALLVVRGCLSYKALRVELLR